VTFLFDLDGTICTDTNGNYPEARPIRRRIRRINALRRAGERIILWTARGTLTGVNWRQLTESQLRQWGVKYDELIFGKPPADFYVCDKAVSVEAWDQQYPGENSHGRARQITHWSRIEIIKLREIYPHLFEEEFPVIFPGRTNSSLKAKALVLGVTKSARKVIFARHFESDELGGYVSGLVDGEGWFAVSLKRKGEIVHCNPKFGMSLRKDDVGVLEFLRNYFGCGNINFAPRPNPQHSPTAIFCISGMYNVLWSVVPHFLRYPLRAKKAKDFTTWHEIVKLAAEHFNQSRWPNESRDRMRGLYRKLLADKAYREPSV